MQIYIKKYKHQRKNEKKNYLLDMVKDLKIQIIGSSESKTSIEAFININGIKVKFVYFLNAIAGQTCYVEVVVEKKDYKDGDWKKLYITMNRYIHLTINEDNKKIGDFILKNKEKIIQKHSYEYHKDLVSKFIKKVLSDNREEVNKWLYSTMLKLFQYRKKDNKLMKENIQKKPLKFIIKKVYMDQDMSGDYVGIGFSIQIDKETIHGTAEMIDGLDNLIQLSYYNDSLQDGSTVYSIPLPQEDLDKLLQYITSKYDKFGDEVPKITSSNNMKQQLLTLLKPHLTQIKNWLYKSLLSSIIAKKNKITENVQSNSINLFINDVTVEYDPEDTGTIIEVNLEMDGYVVDLSIDLDLEDMIFEYDDGDVRRNNSDDKFILPISEYMLQQFEDAIVIKEKDRFGEEYGVDAPREIADMAGFKKYLLGILKENYPKLKKWLYTVLIKNISQKKNLTENKSLSKLHIEPKDMYWEEDGDDILALDVLLDGYELTLYLELYKPVKLIYDEGKYAKHYVFNISEEVWKKILRFLTTEKDGSVYIEDREGLKSNLVQLLLTSQQEKIKRWLYTSLISIVNHKKNLTQLTEVIKEIIQKELTPVDLSAQQAKKQTETGVMGSLYKGKESSGNIYSNKVKPGKYLYNPIESRYKDSESPKKDFKTGLESKVGKQIEPIKQTQIQSQTQGQTQGYLQPIKQSQTQTQIEKGFITGKGGAKVEDGVKQQQSDSTTTQEKQTT